MFLEGEQTNELNGQRIGMRLTLNRFYTFIDLSKVILQSQDDLVS